MPRNKNIANMPAPTMSDEMYGACAVGVPDHAQQEQRVRRPALSITKKAVSSDRGQRRSTSPRSRHIALLLQVAAADQRESRPPVTVTNGMP